MHFKNLLKALALKLFHPPYYRMLKPSNPECHLVFIEKVEKNWGWTSIDFVCYTSDLYAETYVKSKNKTMRNLFNNHPIYEGKI